MLAELQFCRRRKWRVSIGMRKLLELRAGAAKKRIGKRQPGADDPPMKRKTKNFTQKQTVLLGTTK